MTDPDRLTVDSETQEALTPEREHLNHMWLLANTMVWKFGTAYNEEPSRTMSWRGDDCTYYLGRGAWWEVVTGQPTTDNDNWLMAMPDLSDTSAQRLMTEFVLQRISPNNQALASNPRLREQVAGMLHTGIADRLLGWAAETFPPAEEGKPGKGTLLHNDMLYDFTVFGDAAQPFMFVDMAGVRYDLGRDSPLERFDTTQQAGDENYIEGGPEERLLHVMRVLDDGARYEPPRTFTFYERHEPVIPIGQPENLARAERRLVSDAIDLIADWSFTEHTEALYLWEEDTGVYALRTVVPGLWEDGNPAAIGMVAGPHSWVVEVIPLNTGENRHDIITIDLRANTAYCVQTVDGKIVEQDVGNDACEYAVAVMEHLEEVFDGDTLQPCPHKIGERFQHEAIKVPAREDDTVE